jgi:hypothetical protein
LTIPHPPADLATLFACWPVWWIHQNILSLSSASARRIQQQMPKPRQCPTFAEILFDHSKFKNEKYTLSAFYC